MKKLHLLLSIAAILLSFQGAMAYEQRQDALYIFCNDGQFHAFFFGDIDRIAYSKIDTLGIEQPDYVVQEVWALDTVFRIPLAAIDSVAFVTPDTRYKPDVFRPDSSIVDYIVASDSVKWIRLATNTPQAMIPKTGDKFLIEKEAELIPDGFVGRVTSVEQGSDGYTVITGDIDPVEIYDQLVVKVAAASPTPDGSRHAPPHNIDGTVDLSYVMEEPIDIISASGRVDLKMSQGIIPDLVTVEGEGGLNYNLNEALMYRGFLFIDPMGKQCYTHTAKVFHFSDFALDFKGSMTFNGEIPVWKTKTPFSAKFFKLEASAGFFIKLSYTAFTAGFQTVRKDTFAEYHALTANGPISPLAPHPLSSFDYIEKMSHVNELDSTTFSFNNDGTYSMGIGFFGKLDFKFKLPFFKNDSSIVKTGLEGGENISFRAPEISPLVEEGQFADLMNTPEIYNKLNVETDISYNSYAKVTAAINLFGFDLSVDKDEWEWKLQEMGPFGLVPRIDDISCGPDDEDEVERPYRIKFTSPIGRNLLYSVPIGFMVFDDANGLIEDWCKLSYSHEDLMSSYSNVFTTLDPVKGAKKTYRVYARISYLDHAMLTDKWVDVEVDSACIDIERPLLVVDEEVGSAEVSVIPNMAKVECSSTADWLTFTWLDHRNELFVSWAAMPEGMRDRKAKIILQGKNSTTGQPIIEDSVVVWQMVPFINVTPEELNFTAEGGTQTATITGTNLTDFEVFTDYGFIHPSIDGNVITVTVDPSDETDARGGQLHIRGKKPDGETSSTYIYVSQEGKGTEPIGEADFSVPIEAGIPIHFGDNPPFIEGTYEISPVEAPGYITEYGWSGNWIDEEEGDDEIISFINTFSDQRTGTITAKGILVYEEGEEEDEDDTFTGKIMGSGNGFTVYFAGPWPDMDEDDLWWLFGTPPSVVFYTGELDDSGNIKDWWFGEVFPDVELEDDDGSSLGHQTIMLCLKDGDGISYRVYPSTSQGQHQVSNKLKNLMAKELKRMLKSITKRVERD